MKLATCAALATAILTLSTPVSAQSANYSFCYGVAGNPPVNNFATAAEASAERQRLMAGIMAPYTYVEVDWTPAAQPAAATAPAPKPQPAAAAAKRPSPPPAPAAAAPASTPGVFVICRSEFNTDRRRFYNPPIEGRGAGYPEWQASYRAYLVSHFAFQPTNVSCGKYPTREAAQADYDAWVAAARASPTLNGLESPIEITDWAY